MKIDRDEIVHVAQLSRLTLTEAELVRMQQDLAEILEDMRTLEELESRTASDMSKNTLCNVTREDTVCPSFDRAVLLANAPAHNGESIIVPKTVE